MAASSCIAASVMTSVHSVHGINMFTRYVLLAGMLVGTLGHPSMSDTALTESQLDDHRLNDSNRVVPTNRSLFPFHAVKRRDSEPDGDQNKVSCENWDAYIAITAPLGTNSVEADVDVISDPGCTTYKVVLWRMYPEQPYYIPCYMGMLRVKDEAFSVDKANWSHTATFKDIPAGNYCVRVEPCISSSDSSSCVTLHSSVVELPEMTAYKEAVVVRREGEKGYYVLLLLPIVGTVVFLGYILYRQKKTILNLPYASTVEKLAAAKVVANPPVQVPVIRVVYSRDSPQHIDAVAALCHFLETEVDVRVVYDGNAEAEAHLTADWAIAMADVYCPEHSKQSPKSDTIERILIIESEGGLIKQDAHHNYKDVGLAATDCMDEMYHTTFTALLSRQAQALCDYCHIFVARFPYSAHVGRLNLVPEKRYELPEKMRALLEDMLHTKLPQGRIPALDRLDQIMESEAYRQLLLVVDNAKNSLDENPNMIKDKLRTIITI